MLNSEKRLGIYHVCIGECGSMSVHLNVLHYKDYIGREISFIHIEHATIYHDKVKCLTNTYLWRTVLVIDDLSSQFKETAFTQ